MVMAIYQYILKKSVGLHFGDFSKIIGSPCPVNINAFIKLRGRHEVNLMITIFGDFHLHIFGEKIGIYLFKASI
jgi:hypothetical protein